MTYGEDLAAYRRALGDAEQWVAAVDAPGWGAPTPCAGWDVATLVTHLIGQNQGFARAVSTGDAEAEDFTVAPPPVDDALERWRASAARVGAAFARADQQAAARLVEVDPQRLIPIPQVLRMHLLDTAVHTWDLAVALGGGYRPDADLVERVHAVAQRVPAGATRERPGAAFAPVRPQRGADQWLDALAVLGRDPS